jgi:ornithine cyclodeaminase/alanine dehydrogenase-like protein (mu-crystallin family)
VRIAVSGEKITAACDLKSVMETQRNVFANHYNGAAFLGPRAVLSQGQNAQFAYLARASSAGPTIVKFGTVFPNNPIVGLPAVQTSILVLSAKDGSVSHEFDGETITELRTVAASMVAIERLANPPKKVAVIGLGHQGIAHAKAIRGLFSPNEIIGISKNGNASLSANTFDRFSNDISEIDDCDLIVASTSSSTPVVNSALKAGTTCISIGSFSPDRAEVSIQALKGADPVIVDDCETARKQCGSISQFIQSADYPNRTWSELRGIGQVIAENSGRCDLKEVIYYFSVGLGIQDAALIELVLERI